MSAACRCISATPQVVARVRKVGREWTVETLGAEWVGFTSWDEAYEFADRVAEIRRVCPA